MAKRPGDPSLREVLFRDVRARELSRTLRRDLKDLLRFYLDEERRQRLQAMRRLPRAAWVVIFLLKSLLAKLTPGRRLLLAAAILAFLLDTQRLGFGDLALTLNLRPWSFLFLLVVLMLELKDKLLARDEIEVARQVQLALLPREHPRPDGWSLWSCTRPANDVGGDLIDYLVTRPGSIGVALGDVAGKGLGAALLMAKLQATLRSLAPECRSLADLGARMNTILCRDGLENRFATLFYVEISPGSPHLRYLNAGHNPPCLLRASGAIESLEASARPLGMFPDGTYGEGSTDLAPSDLLVVYSDGLVEAQNGKEEEFGIGRLRGLLAELRGLSAEEAGARILADVDRFLGEGRPHDDLSLVIIQKCPEAGSSPT